MLAEYACILCLSEVVACKVFRLVPACKFWSCFVCERPTPLSRTTVAALSTGTHIARHSELLGGSLSTDGRCIPPYRNGLCARGELGTLTCAHAVQSAVIRLQLTASGAPDVYGVWRNRPKSCGVPCPCAQTTGQESNPTSHGSVLWCLLGKDQGRHGRVEVKGTLLKYR